MNKKSDIVTLDFETYYSREYSLSKLTYSEYIHDPRFEVIGVSAKIGDAAAKSCFGSESEIKLFLRTLGLENKTVICHNAQFDGAILEWHYGIKPDRYFCTMMAARALVRPFTPRGSVSLAKVADYFGIGVKGTAVHNAINMRKMDFTPAQLDAYKEYCELDVNLTHAVYLLTHPDLPEREHMLIDATIKKFTRPKFVLDKEILQEQLDEHRAQKAELLETIGLTDRKMLMSNAKFADALISLGVTPPTKISPTTGKEAFAFAKTDKAMKDLLDHPDPMVSGLVAARLGHKSTIVETRLQRLLDIANRADGKLPIALLYYGAHTGRFSGTQKLNPQNFTYPIRKALKAPYGHKVFAVDASQIECRITACLAGQWDLVQQFRDDLDPYSIFATKLYGYKVTNCEETYAERFVGKTCLLGLQYGVGHAKFFSMMDLNDKVEMTEAEAKRIVRMYRDTYNKIPQLWRKMNTAIECMATGSRFDIGPAYTTKEAIVLPNGMKINYPNLAQDANGDWHYDSPRGSTKLYGAKALENLVQALAQIIVGDAEIRLMKRGLRAALQVHDELVYIAPEKYSDTICKALEVAMTAKVEWMPELPVACEVGYGDSYYDAK